MPTTVADPRQSIDSEQISPETIAHHTVYEKTPNLQQSHVCQWEAQPYLVGPLSRLVGKPPFEPSLSMNVLPLTKAANGPNSAISLTQTFDHILFYVFNSRYFEVQKEKNGNRGTIVFSAALKRWVYYHRGTRSNAMTSFFVFVASMFPPKRFSIFPQAWGVLRRFRCVQTFL